MKKINYHLSPVAAALTELVKQQMNAEVGATILLTGVPGCGKTQYAHYLCDILGAELYRYDCNTESNIGIMYSPDLDGLIRNQAAWLPGPLWDAFEASKSRRVVILVDELDKSPADFDAYMLRVLEEKSFNNPKNNTIQGNPANIVFILTSNNRRQLRDELLRRMLRLTMPYPDIKTQQQIVLEQSWAGATINLARVMVKIAQTLREKIGYEKAASPKEVVYACDIAMSMSATTTKPVLGDLLTGCLVKGFTQDQIRKLIGYDWLSAIITEVKNTTTNNNND